MESRENLCAQKEVPRKITLLVAQPNKHVAGFGFGLGLGPNPKPASVLLCYVLLGLAQPKTDGFALVSIRNNTNIRSDLLVWRVFLLLFRPAAPGSVDALPAKIKGVFAHPLALDSAFSVPHELADLEQAVDEISCLGDTHRLVERPHRAHTDCAGQNKPVFIGVHRN